MITIPNDGDDSMIVMKADIIALKERVNDLSQENRRLSKQVKMLWNYANLEQMYHDDIIDAEGNVIEGDEQ